MSKYKLIACDLDGTLIGSDLVLSNENHNAIADLTEVGVHIVPTTGRTISEMRDVFDLPQIRYVIYSNGAAVYDKKTGENIFLGLDKGNSRFVYDTLSKFDTFIVAHKDGQTYADKKKENRFGEYHINREVENLIKKYCVLHNDFKSVFWDGKVESVAVFFATNEEKNMCRDILSSNPDIYSVEGWNYNLEIFYKDAGKGNALKYLTQKLGIEMDDVISIGDSDNDRQMTIMSGLGLVVNNGCESLKEVADQIICSNDGHVIQYVKDNYFVKNEK